MNEADFLICAVLLISTVVGVSRGVVREILAIVAWVVAIFLAIRFAPELGDKIPLESMGPLVRNALAGVVIVVLTLFAFGLFGKLCARLLAAASISFEDRAIGSVFGFARGVLIVCAAVFILGMTSAVRTGQWRNSVLIVPAERIIDFTVPYLPDAVGDMRRKYKVR